jgi:alkanesulfonate monooxygenase SsuD/methylene tetrahydromethanopterin reductase-like flavin-dependent oxidoreductase (luciferase family)
VLHQDFGRFAVIQNFDFVYPGYIDLDNAGYAGTPVNERRYPNAKLATALTKARRLAVAMDTLGYDAFWMGEHHFQHEGTECIPNVLLMALHLTHMTKSLRIGCGVNIVPMWHPLRLAEDYAVVDHLSNGRVIFGVGRGYHSREVETLGGFFLDQEANRDLFEEQVDIIFKAFNQESFSHSGKNYTLPPRIPYRGYTLQELTLVPRPKRLPVECWQPVQSGGARGLDFMVKHGIKGLMGGGSAEGEIMMRIVKGWQDAHARAGQEIALGEGLSMTFLAHLSDTREKAIAETSKYYEENTKLLGELRLVRAMSNEQIEAMRDPKRAPSAGLPSVQEAIDSGGFLCGSADQIIESLKALEAKFPGLDRIALSTPIGTPESMIVEMLHRFAAEVMTHFPRKAKAAA